jgi:hypothetical protein
MVFLSDKDVFNWMHVIFLSYPSMTNYFLVLIQSKNFEAKVQESKALAIDFTENQ